MKISDIVSISGMPGLYKISATRPDGLIVQSFDSDQTKFIASRIHLFTTLDNITIYTSDEPEELINVLKEMKKKAGELPPADIKGDGDLLKDYFKKIIPTYDEERVYVSDIKKVIKWFHVLDQNKVLENLEKTSDESDTKTEAEVTAAVEEKPKAKPKKKSPAKKKPAKKETEKKTEGKKSKS